METTTETIDTSYEPFSREPEYIDLNRAFIRGLGLQPGARVLDLACGTGTLIEILLQELRGEASVVGVDLSRRSLMLAREDLGAACHGSDGRPARVVLIEATADRPPVEDGAFDAVLMGNAIHCFPDLELLFSEVRRVLRPGGLFAFNSSFYAGTFVPGTEVFYDEWLKESVRWLKRRDAEERRAGRPGIPRKRGTVGAAFSRRWLNADEYAERLARHGLRARRLERRTVVMSRRAFETVGAYEGMAAVLLSGYPVALACEALTRSVGAGLHAAGLTEVPRYWLEMDAIREETPCS